MPISIFPPPNGNPLWGTIGGNIDDQVDLVEKISDILSGEHNHDDRYYTETEIDGMYEVKADVEHNHDEDYYSKIDVDAMLEDKAAVEHNHDDDYEPKNSNIQTHIASTSNPHGVTKSQIGLGDVENKSAEDILSEIEESHIPSAMSANKIVHLQAMRSIETYNTNEDEINNTTNKIDFTSSHIVVINLNSEVSADNIIASDNFTGITEGFYYTIIMYGDGFGGRFDFLSGNIVSDGIEELVIADGEVREISLLKIGGKNRWMIGATMEEV